MRSAPIRHPEGGSTGEGSLCEPSPVPNFVPGAPQAVGRETSEAKSDDSQGTITGWMRKLKPSGRSGIHPTPHLFFAGARHSASAGQNIAQPANPPPAGDDRLLHRGSADDFRRILQGRTMEGAQCKSGGTARQGGRRDNVRAACVPQPSSWNVRRVQASEQDAAELFVTGEREAGPQTGRRRPALIPPRRCPRCFPRRASRC